MRVLDSVRACAWVIVACFGYRTVDYSKSRALPGCQPLSRKTVICGFAYKPNRAAALEPGEPLQAYPNGCTAANPLRSYECEPILTTAKFSLVNLHSALPFALIHAAAVIGCRSMSDPATAGADMYRRNMELRFPRRIKTHAELCERLAFLEDDRITAVDLSHNEGVTACPELHSLLRRLGEAEQQSCADIDFSKTGISEESVSALRDLAVKSPKLRSIALAALTLPQLDWSRIVSDIAEILRGSRLLRSLDLSGNPLKRNITNVFNAMRENDGLTIERFILYDVGLEEASVDEIASALCRVQELDVGGNRCDLSLIDWQAFSKLQDLHLRKASAVGSLSGLVNCPVLRSLDLSGTSLTIAACENLKTMLTDSRSIRSLKMADCRMGEMQLQLVLDGISCSVSLDQELNLGAAASLSPAANDAWKAFCRRLWSIEKVSLRECCLTSTHVEELVRAYYEGAGSVVTNLSDIDLSANILGNEGADWAGELIKIRQIRAVHLIDNGITDGSPVYEALSERHSAKSAIKADVSGHGPRHNKFLDSQTQWLTKFGFRAAPPPKGANPEAAPFIPPSSAAVLDLENDFYPRYRQTPSSRLQQQVADALVSLHTVVGRMEQQQAAQAPDETPSPVRQVRQFQDDEVAAAKLQQEFDDEARAAEIHQVEHVHDEFDAATRQLAEERSRRTLERLGGNAQ